VGRGEGGTGAVTWGVNGFGGFRVIVGVVEVCVISVPVFVFENEQEWEGHLTGMYHL